MNKETKNAYIVMVFLLLFLGAGFLMGTMVANQKCRLMNIERRIDALLTTGDTTTDNSHPVTP